MFLSFSFIIFENQNSDKNSLKLFSIMWRYSTRKQARRMYII